MSSPLEQTLAWQIKAAGLPQPCPEYLAIPGRKFRFDFAWPEIKLLVEVQGGTFAKSKTGHSSGLGINRDCEKTVLAQLAGWRVFPLDEKHITSGKALVWIQEAMR